MRKPPSTKGINSIMLILILALIIMNFNKAARLEAAGGSSGGAASYLGPSSVPTQAPELSIAQEVELYDIVAEAVAYMFIGGPSASADAGFYRCDYDSDGNDDFVVSGGEQWLVCTRSAREISCLLLGGGDAGLAQLISGREPEPFGLFKKTGVGTELISKADALIERFPFVMAVERLDLHTDGVEDYVLYLEADPDYGPRGVAMQPEGGTRLGGSWAGCCIVLISAPDTVHVRICSAAEAGELIAGAGSEAFAGWAEGAA